MIRFLSIQSALCFVIFFAVCNRPESIPENIIDIKFSRYHWEVREGSEYLALQIKLVNKQSEPFEGQYAIYVYNDYVRPVVESTYPPGLKNFPAITAISSGTAEPFKIEKKLTIFQKIAVPVKNTRFNAGEVYIFTKEGKVRVVKKFRL